MSPPANVSRDMDSSGEADPSGSPSQGRGLLFGFLLWTGFAAVVVGWLMIGSTGPSVWVFEERDLAQPGFAERVAGVLHSDVGLQRAYPWILFGPYLAAMAWFFPLERERLLRNLPLNAAACLAFVLACHGINRRTTLMSANLVMVRPEHSVAPGTPQEAGAFRFPGVDDPGPPIRPLPLDPNGSLPPPGRPTQSLKTTVRSTVLDLLVYGAFTGLVHSVNFHRRLRERERRALFLESNLTKARLNVLKAQLQPHFLFNSLNAITSLLRRDPRLAETTLVALSEMLRMALHRSENQESALREELDFVERYLEIQRVRFGDKLKVELNIEPETLDCRAPTLVLQPLVENAIRHGIEPAEAPGTVTVRARRGEGGLVLTVEDDGVGLGVGGGAGTGIGLANLSRNDSVEKGVHRMAGLVL
jgi:two-component sensor histidine kinase